jgi:hypothetical protein
MKKIAFNISGGIVLGLVLMIGPILDGLRNIPV